jgi:acid phosphatase (class A)
MNTNYSAKALRQWMWVVLLTVCSTVCQAQAVVAYPEPFLTDETRPDGTLFLPPPPPESDPAFGSDYYFYQWGRLQRDTPLGQQAKTDGPLELYEVFSQAFGMTISPALTPEIDCLAGGAASDAHTANRRVKNFYQRMRPFVLFNQPTLIPETEEVAAKGYSYPSGHATRGYVYAMTLALVNPDSANVLRKRAYEYALGRVIAGYHYKSDIDASAILAAAIMGELAGNDAFRKQLEKARKEYKALKQKAQKN